MCKCLRRPTGFSFINVRHGGKEKKRKEKKRKEKKRKEEKRREEKRREEKRKEKKRKEKKRKEKKRKEKKRKATKRKEKKTLLTIFKCALIFWRPYLNTHRPPLHTTFFFTSHLNFSHGLQKTFILCEPNEIK
jgi:Flp pilus assembly protein TadB